VACWHSCKLPPGALVLTVDVVIVVFVSQKLQFLFFFCLMGVTVHVCCFPFVNVTVQIFQTAVLTYEIDGHIAHTAE